jgi:hypothetical protein
MRFDNNLIPVESDVNQFLSEDRSLLDNHIADLFKDFNISGLLSSCNIKKRCGHSVPRIVFDLFFIPFLLLSNVYFFVHSQYEKAASVKNRYYRLLENARFNWHLFILKLSALVNRDMNSSVSIGELFFVLDDTITEISGKLVEGASYIYDHVSAKSVLGFQKLVLGIFNGSHFIPVSQRFCSGKKKPKANSKAQKYSKILKSQRIAPDSPGAVERDQMNHTKLQKALELLKEALKKGLKAQTVLFDSWFCFNSFIIQIVEQIGLGVICQLKNLPRTNKYIYKGKSYSLKELFIYFGQIKLRDVKKNQFKQSLLIVSLPNSTVKMKIVFVKNDGSNKWHAFAATDCTLSAQKILECYSQRWSIEVFFKNCKQYLNYGKEQMSNLDSIIACDALVFMRYIFLTYLAFKENATFYEKYTAVYKSKTTKTFGIGLLKFFLDRLQYMVQQIRDLLAQGYTEQAISLLDSIIQLPESQTDMCLE